MFVRDTLTATQIPAFKNYFKKAKEIHRHNSRHTSKDTVEIPQPTTETFMADILYASKQQPLGIMC